MNAGEVKDELAKKWKRTGSLGKKENLSKKNAAATMRAANNVMKKNPNASKKEIINKTQKELGENKEKYLKERKGIREGIKETQREVEKQKKRAFDIMKSGKDLTKKQKQERKEILDEVSKELGPGFTADELKGEAKKKLVSKEKIAERASKRLGEAWGKKIEGEVNPEYIEKAKETGKKILEENPRLKNNPSKLKERIQEKLKKKS